MQNPQFHVPHSRRCEAGFTAIELMVVVAIVAILAALAMPSFKDVVARYRVRQASEELSAMLFHARSEAIKRGGGITVLKASPAGCSLAGANDWSCGWTMFTDANRNGVLDSDDLILQSAPAPRSVSIYVAKANPPSYMEFDGWGQTAPFGALSIEIKSKDNPNADLDVHLCVSSGGRLRMLKGILACK